MLTRPVAEAHGIVWKVVVDGKDAQDEFDEMLPLGVGRHEFKVYFNRPMNPAKAPNITMGVRDPYRSTVIEEEGSWNDSTDVYTAYITLDGRNAANGLNRIVVDGAEDDEYFEVPIEATRFNVMVEAAGSMSAGFVAEPGCGRIRLEWNNADGTFDDVMGYNLYRYELADPSLPTQIDDDGNPTNATNLICLNDEIMPGEQTEFSDVNVEVGTDYYYYFKVMRTNLTLSEPSAVVTASPQTSIYGDANADGRASVADMVTTSNHIMGFNPRPFIHDAADLSGTDDNITNADIVGIGRIIMGQDKRAGTTVQSLEEAQWYMSDGTFMIESPEPIAGLQVEFDVPKDTPYEMGTDANPSGWLIIHNWHATDADRFLILMTDVALSNQLPANQWLEIIKWGKDYPVKFVEVTNKDAVTLPVKEIENPSTGIEEVETEQPHDGNIYNLQGIRVGCNAADLQRLPAGIYILNGHKILKK